MEFRQHFSGSLGNLYSVTNAVGQVLIIDPGVSWGDLLKALDYDLTKVVGCLVTHEHQDHSKSVERLIEAGIEVIMSYGTADGIKFKNDLNSGQIRLTEDKATMLMQGFEVRPFKTYHNTAEPLGFIVTCDNEDLLFAIDTSNITQRFGHKFAIIAIEVSYDKAILQDMVDRQAINEELAKRLLTSHMEKDNAKRYLSEFCNMSRCRELHLLHLSGDNIDREKTREEFEDEFMMPTFIKD